MTTKVRPVYDGSSKAKTSDFSINEVLYRGLDILPKLVGILLRFRTMTIPMVADVEKAFLQISIAPKHRDYLRFLYFKDPGKLPTEDNFKVFRFARVPFGLICSHFLLDGSIRNHLQELSDDELAQQIQENIYVDNILLSAENLEEAVRHREKSKKIFSQISMNLRAWTSNCEAFNKNVPEEDGVSDGPFKLLGVNWDRKQDKLYPAKLTLPTDLTRRKVVGSVTSLYCNNSIGK